jgi:hypothetical protein
MPGMGLLMEGAMQQAPHSGRQDRVSRETGEGENITPFCTSLKSGHALPKRI